VAYSAVILATPGLVSYWRLGESSGNALDSKGTNPGTTVAGGITRAVTGLLTGDADKAAQGNGAVGSYVQVPSSASLDTGAQLSVECWVKPVSLPAGANRALVARSSSSTVFFLEIASSNSYRWYVRDVNSVDTIIQETTGPLPVVGVLHHLVGVYDAAGVFKLYVNGAAVSSAPNRTPNANTRTGTGQALDFFAESASIAGANVVLDEIALYNVALTPAQILAHYQAGIGADVPVGTIVLSGSRTESYIPPPRVYTEGVRSGTIVLTGSRTESWISRTNNDFPVGAIVLAGSKAESISIATGVGLGRPVRELPPLRLHMVAVAPSGRSTRWGHDEPRAENSFNSLRFGSSAPGGFDTCDAVLTRDPQVDYRDLERLATLLVMGPGGDIAGEYRLERAPETSGDQMSTSPAAVGWQAHLDDNKDVRVIYIDRDLSHWTEPNVLRQIFLADSGWRTEGGSLASVQADTKAGTPAGLQLAIPEYTPTKAPLVEAWYYGHNLIVAKVNGDYVTYDKGAGGLNTLAGTWTKVVSGIGLGTGPGSFNATPGGDAVASLGHPVGTAVEGDWRLILRNLRVIGNHGLPLLGATADIEGLLASDIVGHAVKNFAPMLVIKDDSIQASSFVLAHIAFTESTTVSEIVKQATRFNLADWGVWEGREFQWYERNTRGRRWRARIAPAQLQETGQQIDRLWESVVVQYNDVDGTPLTVGPIGSGAMTESALLKDTDPENPANKIGITRRDKLVMGVSTVAQAIQVGQAFLQEQKLLDRSGQARIVGHVTDDHGVLHPYWRMRAGDQISFIDASDTSYRRIVKVNHDDTTKTATIDIDAPPEGLDAFLERLGASIVSLGFS
jgi:Concanavalin A-like lectin/glucanases superfamily